MGIIDLYPPDSNIERGDKVLGTDVSTGKTRNYDIGEIKDYIYSNIQNGQNITISFNGESLIIHATGELSNLESNVVTENTYPSLEISPNDTQEDINTAVDAFIAQNVVDIFNIQTNLDNNNNTLDYLTAENVYNKTRIANLESNQYSGVIAYQTYAEMIAITPSENVSYKVTNDDTDVALNGYYTWSSSGGWNKDYDLAAGDIELSNSEPVTGGKIYDHVFSMESLSVKEINENYNFIGFISSSSGLDDTYNNVYTILSSFTLGPLDLNPGDRIRRTNLSTWEILPKTSYRPKLYSSFFFDVLSEALTDTNISFIENINGCIASILCNFEKEADTEYSLTVAVNTSSSRALRVFQRVANVNTEICNLTVSQTEPRNVIEYVTIPEYNSSGKTVNVLIDWSRIDGLSISGLHPNIYKFSDRCFSSAFYRLDIKHENEIIELNKRTTNLVSGLSELSLENWSVVGDVIQSQATGWDSYADYHYYLNEDRYRMSAKIKEVAATYFEIGIGRRASQAGTAVTLRKDATGSYLVFWKLESSYLTPTEITSETQTLATELETDKEYVLVMKKDVNELVVEIVYPTGEVFSHTVSGLNVGYSWGIPSIYCITGQCEASDFSFAMPYNRNAKLFYLADSFGEGNSIPTQKELRYISLLANDIGSEDVAILAKGGETSLSIVGRIFKQIDWFKNSPYCLIAIGTNDSDYAQWLTRLQTWISYLENYNIVPILATVTARDDWDNTTFQSLANAWIRSSGYKYIDLSLAVTVDGDERTWRDGLRLDDLVHPSVDGHAAMYGRIKFDAPYLFD